MFECHDTAYRFRKGLASHFRIAHDHYVVRNVTGTGPTFVEMTLVTEEAMYPSGALRNVKLKPPSPI